MISDVPLGAFLSGGLDSSSIVAFARQYTNQKLQCFTIDFDQELAKEEGFVSDLPYARRVAKHLDVDLHIVRVGPEIASGLPAMVEQLDEPLADFAALNVFFIAGLARQQGIKVLLSGAGGDDVFTGYRRHRALGLNFLWDRLPGGLQRMLSGVGRRLPARRPLLRRVAKLLSVASMQGDERLASYFDWASPEVVRDLFVRELAPTLDEEPLLEALRKAPDTATPLQRMLLLEQQFFLGDHNLIYTDKMSMAASVETRVPFLDPEVMTLAASIPDQYRQRGAVGKWILKKAMEGILPADVIYRPKMGFGVPLRAWLHGPLQNLSRELLSPDTLRKRGIFDPEAVSHLLRDEELGRADHAYSILSLMCIELWCRSFLDKTPGSTDRIPFGTVPAIEAGSLQRS
jgi:asparagine synthase (glutamine-hydrolysing)